jgi:hypothetical protein
MESIKRFLDWQKSLGPEHDITKASLFNNVDAQELSKE